MYQCTVEVLSIVAMLSVPQVWIRGKEKEKERSQEARKRFAHMDGDHFALLNVYNQFKLAQSTEYNAVGGVEGWCRDNFLNHRTLTS